MDTFDTKTTFGYPILVVFSKSISMYWPFWPLSINTSLENEILRGFNDNSLIGAVAVAPSAIVTFYLSEGLSLHLRFFQQFAHQMGG